MTSDFTVPLCSLLAEANDYTSQIHKVFDQHWNTLESERKAMMERIDVWRHDSKERINKYADKQKTLINDHYNRLRPTFDEKYEENLDTANECYDAKQHDLFKDLYKECQSLRFQVATLNSVKYEIEHPEVTILREQIEKKTLETRDDARRRRRLNHKNNNEIENASTTNASSPSDSVASNSKQIECVYAMKYFFVIVHLLFLFSDQQLPEEKPKKKSNQTRSTTNDSNNQVTNVDESNNKCPVCFMIFPLSMTSYDRQQHVNEHYIED
jgi:hypothetical protein